MNFLRIFDHTESQYTGTDDLDEQDSSSCESSDDSVPTPDQNNILLESNNSSPPPDRDTLTEREIGGSIFDSSGKSTSTISNQVHSDVLVRDQALIALERTVTRPTVESKVPIWQQAQIAKINPRLPTGSTILPVSALTSRNNSICFPRINYTT